MLAAREQPGMSQEGGEERHHTVGQSFHESIFNGRPSGCQCLLHIGIMAVYSGLYTAKLKRRAGRAAL